MAYGGLLGVAAQGASPQVGEAGVYDRLLSGPGHQAGDGHLEASSGCHSLHSRRALEGAKLWSCRAARGPQEAAPGILGTA